MIFGYISFQIADQTSGIYLKVAIRSFFVSVAEILNLDSLIYFLTTALLCEHRRDAEFRFLQKTAKDNGDILEYKDIRFMTKGF